MFARIKPVIFPSQTSLTSEPSSKVLSKEVSPYQKDLQGTYLKGERESERFFELVLSFTFHVFESVIFDALK